MCRIDYIDVAKGLGILIVVLGHCLVFAGLWSSNLFWYIYAFHMPFWFVLSGMLYKKKDWASFITGKVSSLIIPFVSYFVLNMLIYALLTIFGATQYYYHCSFGAFWFLITLFIIVITHYYLDEFLYSKCSKPFLLQAFVAICTLLLGLNYSRYIADQPNQPVATACVGYAYFILGLSLKRVGIVPPKKSAYRIGYIIAGILLSIVLLFTAKHNGTNNIDMNTSRYLNKFMFVMNSLLGIVSFILLSIGISRNKILQDFGRNSLSIMMIHIPVCKSFLFVGAYLGVHGYIPATLAVIISFIISYIAIAIFNKYCPFMLGKININ